MGAPNFIESKGADGMDLVRAMSWAETQGRQNTISNAMVIARYPDMIPANTLEQLHLLMQNWTDGSAEKVIMYNVVNGLDALRKLYYDQRPASERQQQQMLLNEFHHFAKALGLKEVRGMVNCRSFAPSSPPRSMNTSHWRPESARDTMISCRF